ncbi:MAG: sulfatase [Verrucomicrobiota bacterium]|nr:sulfatase [Verrucomicrobiota bacterium]
MRCVLYFWALMGAGVLSWATDYKLDKVVGVKPRNIIFILTDDHRFDAMGFMGHPFLETPHMDALAKGGSHFTNAFVTTSLCSPSRASILTGLYAHNHGVVDNYNPLPKGLVFFPQYLQANGYQTAFIGKWHMGGNIDHVQRGFDHWVSFKGQGTYWADGRGTARKVPQNSYDGFNVNGKRVPQKGYITDELTSYSLDWLKTRKDERPFFLMISHKAVHADFVAADRHLGRYKDKRMPLPKTFANTKKNYLDKPMWLKNQRNSRHGVDFAYNLPDFDLNNYYLRYCETLLAVDDHVGALMNQLKKTGQLERTLVVYMGDNGFQFGEHGLIDKRTAYEHSMRVPLLMHCPERVPADSTVKKVVANIDLGPTLIEAAGFRVPKGTFDGASFWPIACGKELAWRDYVLYEYFWERNYPHTPTIHAVRGARYKYIRYHGIWDMNELYDLQDDPDESKNLIFNEKYKKLVEHLNTRLFELLRETGGLNLRLAPDRGPTFPMRHPDRARPADYPREYYRTLKKDH